MKAITIALICGSLIGSAVAAATPAPTTQQLLDSVTHTEEQCIAIVTKQKTPSEVIKEDKLTTQSQKDDFAVKCMMMMDGFDAGRHAHGPSGINPTT